MHAKNWIRRSRLGLGVALAAMTAGGAAYAPAWAQVAATDAAVPAGAIVSPDGSKAAWPTDDRAGFWFAERTAGGWSAPKKFVLRGVVRSPVFSPDSRKLAFENLRGGYATGPFSGQRSYSWSYIAVYDFAKGAISYVDPAFARDAEPRWASADTISYVRRVEGIADAAMTAPVDRPHRPRTGNSAVLAALLETAILYQPVASGDGRTVAFSGREGRTRSIYVIRPGEKARRVATYPDDDGQELSQPALSRDAGLLAYTRGSGLNGKGEVANPRSFVAPPQREVWLVADAPGSTPRSLGLGDSPRFSPDGSRLIWLTPRGMIGARVAAGTVGAGEMILPGPATNVRFSPDGNRLVFERSGRIEILDLRSSKLSGIAKPSDATDADPSWSPDGAQVAFVRTFGGGPPRGSYNGPFETSQPWAIVTADADSMATRQIWRADAGRGSLFYGLDPDPTKNGIEAEQLLWSADGQIAFAWEKDGWRHLYAVPSTGGGARLLTPGDGEVEKATLSLDRKAILYAHNIGDLPGRHVSSIGFGGGAPTALGGGATNQWSPTALAGGGVAFIDAGWSKAQSVVVRTGGRLANAGPAMPNDYPVQALVQPTAIDLPASDGQRNFGQLFVPKQPTGCGIVFVHGGVRRQMLLGFHYMDAYSYLYALNQYLVSRGCTVLSVEYRGSIMRGEAYRNAPGFGAPGGASEYADLLGGARYLLSRTDLGVKKIGIHGLSYGGYLTAQALGRNSDLFQVGFDMAGVHEYPGEGFQHSPAAFLDQWASPVLIASGDDDRNVDHSQSMMLYSELMRRKPAYEVVGRVLPNETHDLYLSIDALTDIYDEGSEFLLKYAMPAK
jgi:dipeptidyl aminopeptidase/acylaminoacyl peptidase